MECTTFCWAPITISVILLAIMFIAGRAAIHFSRKMNFFISRKMPIRGQIAAMIMSQNCLPRYSEDEIRDVAKKAVLAADVLIEELEKRAAVESQIEKVG